MPFIDISPVMDHPAWKTLTQPEREKALSYWRDPATTEAERAEMRTTMDEWAAAAAQRPSAASRVVSSAGAMAQEIPGLAYNVAVRPFVRAGGYDPHAVPRTEPPSAKEIDQKAELLAGKIVAAGQGALGLMLGPAMGKASYAGGEALLSKLAPRLPETLQTAARALPAVSEAGGNYLSRQANVAMGTEQPGVVGDIASAALPLAWRGATSAPVARRLPGSAVTQHEMAAEDIRQGMERMQPVTPSETLYRAVGQNQNPAIDITDLRQTSRDLIKQHTSRGKSTRDTRVLDLAQELDDLGTHYGNQVPMNVLYDRMKAVGEMAREAQSKGGRSTQELSNIYAGFHGALENAVQHQVPGAETLQSAIKASRQEHAVDRLQKIIGQDTGEGRGIATQDVTGYTFVRGKKMLNDFERALADDEVFNGSFTADEKADMRQLFTSGSELPKLPVPGSVAAGSLHALTRAGIGSGIGYALGGQQGAAIGGSAALAAPEVIARAMMHPLGRQYLRAALEGRGGVSPQTLAVINEVIREAPEAYTSKRSASAP